MIKKSKKGSKSQKGKKSKKGKKTVKNTNNNKNSDKKDEAPPTLGLTRNQDGIELRNINNQQYVGDIKVGTPP